MIITRTPSTFQKKSLILKAQGKLGFVPTMGALHEGHLSLIKKSKKENQYTSVSIFVNPLQFGPQEDLKKYPKPHQEDLKKCKEAGVDLIFLPSSPEDFYATNHSTYVEETQISQNYCGQYRPDHFKGVTTVVLKLLQCAQADHLYMGQKDYQQYLIIKQMIRDLNLPIKIKMGKTIREKSGLALSSRNRYLSQDQKKSAQQIYQTMKKVKVAAKITNKSNQKWQNLEKMLQKELKKIPNFTLQYGNLAERNTLSPLTPNDKKAVILVAGYIGKTRLIDNLLL